MIYTILCALSLQFAFDNSNMTQIYTRAKAALNTMSMSFLFDILENFLLLIPSFFERVLHYFVGRTLEFWYYCCCYWFLCLIKALYWYEMPDFPSIVLNSLWVKVCVFDFLHWRWLNDTWTTANIRIRITNQTEYFKKSRIFINFIDFSLLLLKNFDLIFTLPERMKKDK